MSSVLLSIIVVVVQYFAIIVVFIVMTTKTILFNLKLAQCLEDWREIGHNVSFWLVPVGHSWISSGLLLLCYAIRKGIVKQTIFDALCKESFAYL